MSYVGIDVSKGCLDVVSLPYGEALKIGNDREGIASLVDHCKQLIPEKIVLEATGGYKRDVSLALVDAGLPVVIVNARQVRDFAKAIGQLAKTDQIDAVILATFAERIRPRSGMSWIRLNMSWPNSSHAVDNCLTPTRLRTIA